MLSQSTLFTGSLFDTTYSIVNYLAHSYQKSMNSNSERTHDLKFYLTVINKNIYRSFTKITRWIVIKVLHLRALQSKTRDHDKTKRYILMNFLYFPNTVVLQVEHYSLPRAYNCTDGLGRADGPPKSLKFFWENHIQMQFSAQSKLILGKNLNL